jgi:hypothetical protein
MDVQAHGQPASMGRVSPPRLKSNQCFHSQLTRLVQRPEAPLYAPHHLTRYPRCTHTETEPDE